MLPDAPTLTRTDYEVARDAAEDAGKVEDGKLHEIISDTIFLTAEDEAVEAARDVLEARTADYADVTVREYENFRSNFRLVAFGVDTSLTARVRHAVTA